MQWHHLLSLHALYTDFVGASRGVTVGVVRLWARLFRGSVLLSSGSFIDGGQPTRTDYPYRTWRQVHAVGPEARCIHQEGCRGTCVLATVLPFMLNVLSVSLSERRTYGAEQRQLGSAPHRALSPQWGILGLDSPIPHGSTEYCGRRCHNRLGEVCVIQ